MWWRVIEKETVCQLPASTLTYIHMYIHLSPYVNIHANMHIFHTHMTKMELNCYFELLKFNTLIPIYT